MSPRDAADARERPASVGRLRRAATIAAGFLVAGAFYLLLIDMTDLPELYAGTACALLAALAFEAAREQTFTDARVSARWLLRTSRVLLRIPPDIARVSLAAFEQLRAPRASRGVLRAVPFPFGAEHDASDAGRRALAEGLGSLAPNTIVIGIDPESDLLLVHQLRRSGDAASLDVLDLR